MDVADQFHEIRIFFADDRFVSVLEKVTTTFVAFIKGDGVSSHEPAHDLAERCRACTQEEVEMVRNQGLGIALGLGFFQDNEQNDQGRSCGPCRL